MVPAFLHRFGFLVGVLGSAVCPSRLYHADRGSAAASYCRSKFFRGVGPGVCRMAPDGRSRHEAAV